MGKGKEGKGEEWERAKERSGSFYLSTRTLVGGP